MIIHDYDLKRSALEAQEELHGPNFQAMFRWIQTFKQNHNIFSQKVTKFQTRSQVTNTANITVEAIAFIKNFTV